jgi:altronate dehydratase
MNRLIASLIAAAPLFVACGASYPVPTQSATDAKSAERSAAELGANSDPAAQLYLNLADEEIKQADKAIADGDNKRAQFLLVRAKADAELAVAMAKQTKAKQDAQKAADDAAKQTQAIQGAKR